MPYLKHTPWTTTLPPPSPLLHALCSSSAITPFRVTIHTLPTSQRPQSIIQPNTVAMHWWCASSCDAFDALSAISLQRHGIPWLSQHGQANVKHLLWFHRNPPTSASQHRHCTAASRHGCASWRTPHSVSMLVLLRVNASMLTVPALVLRRVRHHCYHSQTPQSVTGSLTKGNGDLASYFLMTWLSPNDVYDDDVNTKFTNLIAALT